MTTWTENVLPALVFTLPAGHPKGTAPALGEMTITDHSGVDQQWLLWGHETDDAYDIAASTAALFYEAEALTAMNGTAAATVTGASGSTVYESIGLPSSPIAVANTNVAAGALTHVGEFRIIARVMNTAAGTGSVTVRLDWGVGDLATYTSNDTTTLTADMATDFRLVDLGLVRIPPAPVTDATQRWQGRIMASSIGGDKLRVDCVMIFPTMFGGEATATSQPPVGTTLAVYDPFDQAAGGLTGLTAPIGAATWTLIMTSSSVVDFAVDATNHLITRSVQDPGATLGRDGRGVTAGTTNYSQVTVSVDINWAAVGVSSAGSGNTGSGVIFRGVNASLLSRVQVKSLSGIGAFLSYAIGGSSSGSGGGSITFSANTWYTLTVTCDASGRMRAWWNLRGAPLGSPVLDLTLAILGPGGTMATGRVGVYDENSSGTTFTRNMDNFTVYSSGGASASDAVLFQNRSMQIAWDGTRRQDFAASRYQPLTNYQGDYLKMPQTRREQRNVRFIVKASRSILGQGPDSGIDDIEATIRYQPRYLTVPSP